MSTADSVSFCSLARRSSKTENPGASKSIKTSRSCVFLIGIKCTCINCFQIFLGALLRVKAYGIIIMTLSRTYLALRRSEIVFGLCYPLHYEWSQRGLCHLQRFPSGKNLSTRSAFATRPENGPVSPSEIYAAPPFVFPKPSNMAPPGAALPPGYPRPNPQSVSHRHTNQRE